MPKYRSDTYISEISEAQSGLTELIKNINVNKRLLQSKKMCRDLYENELKKLKEKMRWGDSVFGSGYCLCLLGCLTFFSTGLILPIMAQLVMWLGVVGGALSVVLLIATSAILFSYSLSRFSEMPSSSHIQWLEQQLENSKNQCTRLEATIQLSENSRTNQEKWIQEREKDLPMIPQLFSAMTSNVLPSADTSNGTSLAPIGM